MIAYIIIILHNLEVQLICYITRTATLEEREMNTEFELFDSRETLLMLLSIETLLMLLSNEKLTYCFLLHNICVTSPADCSVVKFCYQSEHKSSTADNRNITCYH